MDIDGVATMCWCELEIKTHKNSTQKDAIKMHLLYIMLISKGVYSGLWCVA